MNLIGAERHTQRGVLMRRFLWLAVVVAAGIGVLTLGACLGSGAWSGTWTSVFPTEPDELVSTGRNPYFILEPGYTLVLEGGDGRLTITVLNETKKVDGVETRVVEEPKPRAASSLRWPGTISRSASGPTTSSTSAKTLTCTKMAGS